MNSLPRGLLAGLCFFIVTENVSPSILAAEKKLRKETIAVLMGRPGQTIDSPNYLPYFPKAVELAISERKDALARIGLELEVEMVFMEESNADTFKNYQTLLAGKSLAGVGPQSSDEMATGLPVLRNSDLLVVSASATSTALLKEKPNVLLYAATNQEIAEITEEFIKKEFDRKKIVAVVDWDSPYSQNFYQSLSDAFKAKIVLFKNTEDTKQVSKIVKDVMAIQPEIILLPNFPVSSGAFIRGFSESGFKGIFVAGDSWGEGTDGRFAKIIGTTPFEGFMVRQFSIFSQRPAEKRIREKLNAELKSENFGSLVPTYYDAANFVIDLILEAGPNVTRKQLLELSKKHPTHRGVLGVSCLSSTHCPGRTAHVIKVKNAQFSIYRDISR